ncbi:hypothetical protein DSO57_1020161 [Entomophthora muscae]|uniref:Uncharacterized protein n=1 Tax=Entomophthora muscae TaxID=34485 RepID=A0ACC2RIH4_9FUNG|nr:hypothetical protein DSO57_1020161 [Entomophthora muscae]
MSKGSFVDRVELLKKVGKLKFHFRPSPPTTKPDHTLAPIKLYSFKNSVILVLEVSSQEAKNLPTSKPSEHLNTFQLDLPFEISILTLDDNLKKAKPEPNFRRVVTLGFKLTNKENINFDMIETDLDDLDEKLGQIWDAKYFQAVESILCLKCQSSFLTQLPKEDISLLPSPSQEKCVEKANEKTILEAAITAALLPEEIALEFSNLSITKEDTPVASDACTATKQPLFTRFRNLPNEGWEELVDCWVCHSEDYTPHFYKLFCPNPSTLLVGANYLLVNISRLANVSDDKKVCVLFKIYSRLSIIGSKIPSCCLIK